MANTQKSPLSCFSQHDNGQKGKCLLDLLRLNRRHFIPPPSHKCRQGKQNDRRQKRLALRNVFVGCQNHDDGKASRCKRRQKRQDAQRRRENQADCSEQFGDVGR